MSDDLQRFEHQMRKALNEFTAPEETKSKGRRVGPRCAATKGRLVRIAVREKKLAMDQVFEFQSSSISKLQAQIEAEKAARQAGWPIIGWTYSNELSQ